MARGARPRGAQGLARGRLYPRQRDGRAGQRAHGRELCELHPPRIRSGHHTDAGVFDSRRLEGPCQLYSPYRLVRTPRVISSSRVADAESFDSISIVQVSREECDAAREEIDAEDEVRHVYQLDSEAGAGGLQRNRRTVYSPGTVRNTRWPCDTGHQHNQCFWFSKQLADLKVCFLAVKVQARVSTTI